MMTNHLKISAKNQFSIVTILTLIVFVFISAPINAKTDNNAQTKLSAYGEALAEHNRVLGTWALYQGEKNKFKQTLVPNKDGTGIVVADDKATQQYKTGSISKTFTAVLTFKMIEADKLSLDTPLAKFYPNIANAKDITIGQMLNHHSGIASYTDEADIMAYYQSPQTSEQMVARIEALTAAFEPGEKADYSNSNYLLLGYILEQVSGQSYADLLNKHIVEPLNL